MSDLIFKDSAVLFYGACYFFLLWALVNWSLKREIPYQAFVGSFLMLLAGLYLSANSGISVSENELSLLIISGTISYLVSIGISRKLGQKISEFFSEEKKDSKDNETYIALIEKAVNLSVFFIPFLFLINFIMQVVLPIFKTGKEAPNSVIEHLGTFGDFFGGTLNPVLTFATFIALIATILIQLKELRLTREELKNSNEQLKMSREEQAKTARALQEQERTQRIQQFESTFFNMFDRLSVEHDKASTIAKEISDKIVHGAFKVEASSDLCRSIFDHNDVGRFYIFLYQVISFVDASPESLFTQLDKKKYVNMARSIVDNDVLLILFLNCSSSNSSFYLVDGYKKFRVLLERYEFFEHLTFSSYFSYQDSNHKELSDKVYKINNIKDRIENEINDFKLRIVRGLHENQRESAKQRIANLEKDFNIVSLDLDKCIREFSAANFIHTLFDILDNVASSYESTAFGDGTNLLAFKGISLPVRLT